MIRLFSLTALFAMSMLAVAPTCIAQQAAPSAREEITGFEAAFAAQFAASLQAHASTRHFVKVLSRDGKTNLPGTFVDLKSGYVVTTADFPTEIGKTVIIQLSETKTMVGKVVGTSKRDHLCLIELSNFEAAAGNKESITAGIPETGSFVATFNEKRALTVGNITSGVREESKTFAPHEQQALIAHWKRLNLKVSQRRTHFDAVFETDLNVNADACGGPVFSSSGDLIGVVISRAGHHATLVIPIAHILELFEKI